MPECRECGKPIWSGSVTGLCHPHMMAERNRSPEMREKTSAALRRHFADPAARKRQSEAVKATMRNMPEAERERRRAQGRACVPLITSPEVQARAHAPDVVRRRVESRARNMLPWCPPELIPTYRALTRKLACAKQAKAAMQSLIPGTPEHDARTIANVTDAMRIKEERRLASAY